MLDSHVIGLRPGRGATSWPLTPRATSNNMRIQHISISKLDSYNSAPTTTRVVWAQYEDIERVARAKFDMGNVISYVFLL